MSSCGSVVDFKAASTKIYKDKETGATATGAVEKSNKAKTAHDSSFLQFDDYDSAYDTLQHESSPEGVVGETEESSFLLNSSDFLNASSSQSTWIDAAGIRFSSLRRMNSRIGKESELLGDPLLQRMAKVTSRSRLLDFKIAEMTRQTAALLPAAKTNLQN